MPYVALTNKQLPTWERKPPMMLEKDFRVWDQYRKAQIEKYSYFFYNVPITIRTIEESFPSPEIRSQAYYSSAKRIDVVAVKKDESVELFEVCEVAQLRHVGQALGYKTLWAVLKPIPGFFKTIILCQITDPDVIFIARHHDIDVIQILK